MRHGIAVALALLALGILAGCLGDTEGPSRALPGEKIPDVRLHQMEVTEVKDGVKQWHLKAARAEYERASGLGRLRQVEVTFYPGSGEPVVVRSERGTFDSRAKVIRMAGHVRGHAAPFQLFSDDLRYDPKVKALETPGAARLESEGLDIAGRGLHYDLASRRFSIQEDAQTVSQQRLF